MRKNMTHVKQHDSPSEDSQWSNDQLIGAALQAGERCIAWNSEVFRFASDRLRQDAELGLGLAKCCTWTEAAELQSRWVTKTTRDYLDEGTRLLHITTRPFADM